jgi:membrane-bound lytic murein transglycosylase A
MRFFSLILLLLIAGCVTPPPQQQNKEQAALDLRAASFSDLPGWNDDRQSEALAAFQKSCVLILKQSPSSPFGAQGIAGTYAAWRPACQSASTMPLSSDASARAFFEQWFAPWQAIADGQTQGLFTGYYEGSLNGSRTRHGPYQYALRARPGDLVTVDLGEFAPDLKGRKIAGRVLDGRLKPYDDNRAITLGQLPAQEDKALVWVDDPIDAFFLQIQGSGTINLDDGTTMRVGYAAQNGYTYTAIGRELVHRGDLPKDDVSMQSIRAWLKAHPDQAQDIMFTNRSYVFFRELPGNGVTNSGPPGAEGVALTAGRSMAVDHRKLPYGVPVWLDAAPPMPGDAQLERLMVAQDTGGAILGPIRGDVFWGRGQAAETRAGLMKSQGKMWLLLPKPVTP